MMIFKRRLGRSEDAPPPLPLRIRKTSEPGPKSEASDGTLHLLPSSLRPHATTQVSLTDIQGITQTAEEIGDSGKGRSAPNSPRRDQRIPKSPSRSASFRGSDGDSLSIQSSTIVHEGHGDLENMLGDILERGQESSTWRLLGSEIEQGDSLNSPSEEVFDNFDNEFTELPELTHDRRNEEELLNLWKAKRKHFLILSAAGKPIYNRHGDDNLVSPYIGVIQTIISFYQSSSDTLRSFTAGAARFVILTQGPLYLVAISRLGESDAQLRLQLEALYMQILSTLTLPTLTHMFSNRPSTDLRRPLQGTEPLLSALADTFTRGSVPILLSSLECLRLRKAHHQAINSILLKCKVDNLLYGLIVAGGRLVSVIRPKKHSLHPGDLQLIFNMLFEAGGVQAAGGENWIPLCLPGFNNTGFLYMYVSFIDLDNAVSTTTSTDASTLPPLSPRTATSNFNTHHSDSVAIILISPIREAFFSLRSMSANIIYSLSSSGCLSKIRGAVRAGRVRVSDVAPDCGLKHFLYKSKRNVQFVMSTLSPNYLDLVSQRKLFSTYSTLHAHIHAKTTHSRIAQCRCVSSTAFAWMTPQFELYCVAEPYVKKDILAKGASQIADWVKREEERVFILGGAVF